MKSKTRKTLADARLAWENKKKEPKTKVVPIIPEVKDPKVIPIIDNILSQEVILKIANDIKANKEEVKKIERDDMISTFKAIADDGVRESRDIIDKEIKKLQGYDDKLDDLKRELKSVEGSIPPPFHHTDSDHKEISKSIADIKKSLAKTISPLSDKIQLLNNRNESLSERITNLKIPSKHKELEDIYPDDHHPELHLLESHPGLEATTLDLNSLVNGSNADSLHTHKSLAQVIQAGGVVRGGGLSNIVEDTTPQLGGDLDGQAFNITTTGTIGGINVTSGADPGHTHTAYQATDASLTSISGLTYVSGSFIALTAADTYTVRTYAQTLTDIGAAAVGQTMYIGTTGVAINRASAALTLAGLTLTTPDIGTPSAGTLTSCTGLPAAAVVAGTLGNGFTITTPILTKPVINGTNPTGATYTPATGAQTVTIDCATNNMHIVTGHADGTAITFAVSNATNNQPFIVSILQGAVVSTITAWFATVRWAGGTAPTLTATVAKRDTFGFIRTGADTYDGYVIGQNA